MPPPPIGEDRHEQALTREQPLAGAEDRVHHAAARRLLPSPNTVSIVDAGRHVHHRAGFGDGALAGIELDLDELHLAAEDPEVDIVRPAAGHDWRRRSGSRPSARGTGQVRGELRHVLQRRPVLQPLGEHQRVPVDRAVSQIGDDIVLRDGPDLVPANGHVPLLL